MRWIWVSLLELLLLLLGMTDGYLYSQNVRCEFNSTDPDDLQYISSVFYNKLELYRFDSNLGKFVGFTEFGVKTAERFNNDPAVLEREKLQKYSYCEPNSKIWYQNILSKSAKPYGVLHLEMDGTSEKVLVCSVYGFYPKDITVTWTKNHQQIHTGVYTSGPLSDSDWYYQIHSLLKYEPRPEDKISCVIEHVSLEEPLVLDYDGAALPHTDLYKVFLGASGLVLGLVLGLTGFIYHKIKDRGVMSSTKN